LEVRQDLGEWRVITWDGGIETWIKTNNVFTTRHNEYRGELAQLPSGDYEWTTPKRIVWRFRDPAQGPVMGGRLVEIHDFSSNKVQVTWNPEGYLQQVIDTGGGRYDFGFDTARQLMTNITFQGWSINFGYDGVPRLVSKSVTAPTIYTNLNSQWQFFYNGSGQLERVMDPRGNTNVFVQYDRYGRRTNEVDGLGRANSYAYELPAKRQITRTDAEGFKWVDTYDRKHRAIVSQDPLGNTTRFTYDAAGNYSSITDALGFKTLFSYDGRGNVLFQTNALGEVRQWEYHQSTNAALPSFNKAIREITPQPAEVNGNRTWTNYFEIDDHTGNLLVHRDDLGPLVNYTYTTNGLVATRTDGITNVARMRYDTNGFLVAGFDGAGFTNLVARNEWGWPIAETNALGEVTTYAYDLNGKTVRRADSLNRLFTRRFDENGNLLEDFDAKGQVTRFGYDAANQRTQRVDRAGNAWRNTFTPRGQNQTASDPLGNSVTNIYDAANRMTNIALPLGLKGQLSAV
jgi:YD repeat-containing protein